MVEQLSIVQYNCGHSNAQASRALFDSFTHPHVIAVQEPGYSRVTKSTYCPKPYQLAYDATPESRVCFMIRRDVGVSHWKRTQFGPNVATLRLALSSGVLTVVNVYNPKQDGPRVREWNQISLALRAAAEDGETILLGDFNAHHPRWGGVGVACEQNAEHLRVECDRRHLALLTPRGEPTWKRGTQSSVIDLTFATAAIQERIIYCGVVDKWALTQDHIPILVQMDLRPPVTGATSMRYALDKLDVGKLEARVLDTQWWLTDSPVTQLHEELLTILPQCCPKARPSARARPDWSPEATRLLACARRARRRWNAYHVEDDMREFKTSSNSLAKEIRRNARSSWRRLVSELTSEQQHNKGLWKLSRWSRRAVGKPHADPHMPSLRRVAEDQLVGDDLEKAKILAEKFFPPQPQVNHTLDAGESHPEPLPTQQEVTEIEVLAILLALPLKKAPGPDGIPNEVLKALAPTIAIGLAHGISILFIRGQHPATLKESITIALRKEGKKDYSLPSSYRPIALENTLGKVVEKVIANRLSTIAETHGLLPWTQMGARGDRSTASAIGLLTTCVQTAWRARPGSVVSMLSLDLAGAFDNVPTDRLLHSLRSRGIPEWLVTMVASFTQERRTKIAYAGYQGDWIHTATGIPQGSPLSPILFLFFISDLLDQFQKPEDGLVGMGFVDDTNLVAWGASAADNCRRLTAAHAICETWSEANGAKFAPDKYQLIHFTRRKRHAREDLASSIQVGDHRVTPQKEAIRVLGVWLDPALTWKEHVAQATRKGLAASEALGRIATSTWGPSARQTRLLYTAVVRPVIAYGAQEWSMRGNGEPLPVASLAPLMKVQGQCLRKVTGGYKRTPYALLEREAGVMPLDLYLEVRRMQAAQKARDRPVEAKIQGVADVVWRRLRTTGDTHPRPPTGRETCARQAAERARPPLGWGEQAASGRSVGGAQENRTRASPTTMLGRWGEREWKKRWDERVARLPRGRRATAWETPWAQEPRMLYAGLTKAEATALFLMRTEVIGLNGWLAAVGVPEKLPTCPCGWRVQTVRHVLLHCPQYDRRDLLSKCGTERMEAILTQHALATYAARWMVQSGALGQFATTAEITQEDYEGHAPFQDAREWE